MALNFPDSPTLNQVYTDTTSGFSYQWDGIVWKSYTPSVSKNIIILDNISSSFDDATQTFNLSSSSVAFSPSSAQQLLVAIDGAVQEPGDDYVIFGSNISFSFAPTSGSDCSIVSLGPAIPIGTPADSTVTPSKLSTGGPSWNTGGDLTVSGLVNAGFFIGDGSGITGISSVSFATTSFGLEGTPDLNVGVVTATAGFISVGNTTPIQISLVGNQITLTAVGIGSTTFTIS